MMITIKKSDIMDVIFYSTTTMINLKFHSETICIDYKLGAVKSVTGYRYSKLVIEDCVEIKNPRMEDKRSINKILEECVQNDK